MATKDGGPMKSQTEDLTDHSLFVMQDDDDDEDDDHSLGRVAGGRVS